MLTSLVGSYPQPQWLLDREKLRGRQPPRIRAADFWRVEERFLEEAQDAATLMAIRDQERAGLDIITDGEQRRESYSNRVVMALDGIDVDNPGETLDRNGNLFPVPRIVGPIARPKPILIRDAEFLRANTERLTKVTIPGPFTMAQQAQDDHYGAPRDVAFAFADVVRAEIEDLHAAGIDIVQLDEPWMESRADAAREYGIETLQRALEGVRGTTALHICFGYPLFVPGHKRAYRFLAELADAPVDQISIESAQAELDLEVLGALERQDDHPRRDRARQRGRRERRDRRGAAAAGAAVHAGPRRGPRLRDEVPHARVGVRQAPVAGRGREDGVRRARVRRSPRPR